MNFKLAAKKYVIYIYMQVDESFKLVLFTMCTKQLI